jgi:hypothetical protein
LVAVYFYGSPRETSNAIAKTSASVAVIEKVKASGTVCKSSDEFLKLVANLDSMTKITPDALLMTIDRSFECAEGAPLVSTPKPGYRFDIQEAPKKSENLPFRRDNHEVLVAKHVARFEVFVTPGGANAMRDFRAELPFDTVILKRKYTIQNAKEPELYTGMFKREKGYNPDCGDWEFFTVSGDGKTIKSRGKLSRCIDCHKNYSSSDFVTKIYSN